jgi:curved DNA-binding protein CbpA
MSQGSLPNDWLNRFKDPYAVLGVAVTADDQRVLKRNRAVAKLLHPDRHINSDKATQDRAYALLTRLVGPAYAQLSKEAQRRESLLALRQRAQALTERQALQPKSELARQLLRHPAAGVDIFYEQAVAKLAEMQFEPLAQFEQVATELAELNLVYLQLKQGEVTAIAEKRTGLVPAQAARPIEVTPIRPELEVESYDQRHYGRAREYMKNSVWDEAIRELKDAIRLNPRQPDYHAAIGICHFRRDSTGDRTMSKVYFRQALKLDPKHSTARKFAKALGLDLPSAENGASPTQHNGRQNGRVPPNGHTPPTGRNGKAPLEADRSQIDRSGKAQKVVSGKDKLKKSKSGQGNWFSWLFGFLWSKS